jgi:hypothetical protein
MVFCLGFPSMLCLFSSIFPSEEPGETVSGGSLSQKERESEDITLTAYQMVASVHEGW